MKINIKLLDGAKLPTKATPGSGLFDLYAQSVTKDETTPYIEYGTGVCVSFDPDYVLLVYPRSSISKSGYVLANGVGCVDSDYRGEIKLRFYDVIAPTDDLPFNCGNRIGQFMLIKKEQVELNEVDELVPTTRGSGGFGSTGG